MVCLCLSEETLKVGGPFYLVPGEVKDPTHGENIYPLADSLILEKDNSSVSQRLGCLEETT